MSVIIKYCQVKYLILNEICPNEVFYYISFICVFICYVLFGFVLTGSNKLILIMSNRTW